MKFLCRQFLLVDSLPDIDDICQDEGDEQGDIKHRAERELAARGVLHGEGRLEVGRGGIVGGIVPGGEQEQNRHGDDGAETYDPETALVRLVSDGPKDAEEDEHDADEQDSCQRPHVHEVVQVLERFHVDEAGLRVDGIAFARQDVNKESDEQTEEQPCTAHEGADDAMVSVEGCIVHLLVDIQAAEDAGQEDDGKTEDDVPQVEQGIEPVRTVCPAADDDARSLSVTQGIEDILALHDEVRAGEESGDGSAQEQRTEDAVQHQQPLERLYAEQIPHLALELIADSLQHEGEEDNHPEPVRPAETGGIEERIGGKERSAEGDERSEGELPLAACDVDNQPSLVCRAAKREDERVGSLYEHEEDEQSCQQCYDEAPVVLKESVCHNCGPFFMALHMMLISTASKVVKSTRKSRKVIITVCEPS